MALSNKKKNKHIAHKQKSLPKSGHYDFRMWSFIIFILAFLLYANTITHDYVLDDHSLLKDNWITKQGIDGIPTLLKTSYRFGVNRLTDGLYRPLSLVMFAIEWQISPDTPALNHFLNILFYALSCVLLLTFLRNLFGKLNSLLPVLITLLWMAHPIHTEVVANIKSRDEIMSVFFLLIACIWFIAYLKKKQLRYILGASIAFFLGLTSKEGIITMLVIFPLMGWYFTGTKSRSNIKASLLMVIPAAIYLLIRHAVLREYTQLSNIPLVDNLLVAAPDFPTRMATSIYILGKYFLLMLFPVQLVSDYSYNQIPIVGWGNPLVMLSFLLYVGAIVYSFLNIRKKSVLVFGILFFLVTFSIYSNIFVLIGSSFGERFLYLPLLGFVIILSCLLKKIFGGRVKKETYTAMSQMFSRHKTLWIILSCIIVLYSIKTVTRNSEWKNEWTLFSADIDRSPNSAHLRYYWGLSLKNKAKEQSTTEGYNKIMQNAVKEFETALSIYPEYSECYHQLGLAFFRLGDNDKSLENYNKAVKLSPNEAVFYSNMGIIYFQRKAYDKALDIYNKAIAINPNYTDAHMNMGSIYGILGDYNKSLYHLKKALEYDPHNASINYYMALTYQNMKNPEMADKYFEEAYRLNPSLKNTK
ncbi:MAG: tetratricopeptide repeat protein [Bacteroidales bacterium]|nr:tetratricopeptide repeat protein [Bacteroidales bacterium]